MTGRGIQGWPSMSAAATALIAQVTLVPLRLYFQPLIDFGQPADPGAREGVVHE